MTKISNQAAYGFKQNIVVSDYFVGTDSEDERLDTVNFTFGDVLRFIREGLSPLTGGTLKITEISYTGEDFDNATELANSLVPAYEVLQYHIVIFSVNGVKSLFKKQDVTIGDGEDAVSESDFIIIATEITVPDATSTVKGILKLAGDLGGPADSPTTPTAVHKTGNESITGNKDVSNNEAYQSRIRVLTSQGATQPGLQVITESDEHPALLVSSTILTSGGVAIEVITFGNDTTGLKIEPLQNNPTASKMLVLSNGRALNDAVDIGTPLTVLRDGVVVTTISDIGHVTSIKLIKEGGTSTQILMADGTVKEENLQKVITYPDDFTGPDYTMLNSDNNHLIFINNGAVDVTINVPITLLSKASTAFIRQGSGEVSFVDIGGSTIIPNIGLRIKNQNDSVCLDRVLNTNTYHLTGNTKI